MVGPDLNSESWNLCVKERGGSLFTVHSTAFWISDLVRFDDERTKGSGVNKLLNTLFGRTITYDRHIKSIVLVKLYGTFDCANYPISFVAKHTTSKKRKK